LGPYPGHAGPIVVLEIQSPWAVVGDVNAAEHVREYEMEKS
jgi:hypothetical protein